GPKEARHDEFTMTECLGSRQPAAAGPNHLGDDCCASFIECDGALKNARDVDIDVRRHGPGRLWVPGYLDHRQDWIADYIALPGREKMYGRTSRSAGRQHLCTGTR